MSGRFSGFRTISAPEDPFANLRKYYLNYLFPVFKILQMLLTEILCVLLMVSVPAVLLIVPFSEDVKILHAFLHPVEASLS